MLQALTNGKKLPRLFLIQGFSHEDSSFPVMEGMRVVWPEALGRMESDVLDISLSGIVVPSTQLLSKVRMAQSFELKLKIKEFSETPSLHCRVIRMSAQMIGLVFDSISIEGRLTLEQTVKDRLVAQHLRAFSPSSLHPHLRADLWVHGPFDTNFFIWQKEDGAIKQAIVEYDNLLWSYMEGKVNLEKTGSTTEESRGYLKPNALFTEGSMVSRVSMGASWMDRLLRIMEAVDPTLAWAPKFKSLQAILRYQRSQ